MLQEEPSCRVGTSTLQISRQGPRTVGCVATAGREAWVASSTGSLHDRHQVCNVLCAKSVLRPLLLAGLAGWLASRRPWHPVREHVGHPT